MNEGEENGTRGGGGSEARGTEEFLAVVPVLGWFHVRPDWLRSLMQVDLELAAFY